MEDRKIYEDIALRTEGDIYIGVVGPVRTGKSTFIKRFMETMVIPNIENVYRRERARDELPQSGSGRTVMTAETKSAPCLWPLRPPRAAMCAHLTWGIAPSVPGCALKLLTTPLIWLGGIYLDCHMKTNFLRTFLPAFFLVRPKPLRAHHFQEKNFLCRFVKHIGRRTRKECSSLRAS